MPIEQLPDSLEPENANSSLWRFVNFDKFSDLISTAELYFCRADLFDDDQEGLPPEDCMRGNFYPINRDDHLGSAAQFREAFFVNCWHLFTEETAFMWHQFGEDGVRVSIHRACNHPCEPAGRHRTHGELNALRRK